MHCDRQIFAACVLCHCTIQRIRYGIGRVRRNPNHNAVTCKAAEMFDLVSQRGHGCFGLLGRRTKHFEINGAAHFCLAQRNDGSTGIFGCAHRGHAGAQRLNASPTRRCHIIIKRQCSASLATHEGGDPLMKRQIFQNPAERRQLRVSVRVDQSREQYRVAQLEELRALRHTCTGADSGNTTFVVYEHGTITNRRCGNRQNPQRCVTAHYCRNRKSSPDTPSLRERSTCTSGVLIPPMPSSSEALRMKRNFPVSKPAMGAATSRRNVERLPAGNDPRNPAPAVARQPESRPKGTSPSHMCPASTKSVAPRSTTSRQGQPK